MTGCREEKLLQLILVRDYEKRDFKTTTMCTDTSFRTIFHKNKKRIVSFDFTRGCRSRHTAANERGLQTRADNPAVCVCHLPLLQPSNPPDSSKVAIAPRCFPRVCFPPLLFSLCRRVSARSCSCCLRLLYSFFISYIFLLICLAAGVERASITVT